MAERAHTAHRAQGTILVTTASALVFASVACAQTPRAQAEPPATPGQNRSVDITNLLPSFGAATPRSRSRTRQSVAASLPDPRALKGANSREAARLRLNLKGFSVLEARERDGTEVRVRRIREREMRRPVVSLTFQKRF